MKIPEWQSRTELLLGSQNVNKLSKSHVLITGIGGVGGYAAEQLCRAGIGKLTLIDNDKVQSSNRNRQIIALKSTEKSYKTEIFEKRLKDINPKIKLNIICEYIENDNIDSMLDQDIDYLIDAIDTLTPKVNLLEKAYRKKLKIISSMGAGGRKDPTKIKIDDISKSHNCKFASIIRKYLHRKGIYKGIKVVYSHEKVPVIAIKEIAGEINKRSIVGTVSYMPAIFGCYCASAVINDLLVK